MVSVPRGPISCHLFAAQQRATTYWWGGFSFKTTLGIQNPRVEAGLSDTLWSLRTIHITPPHPET